MTDANYSCKTVAHSINYISGLKHLAVFIPVSAIDLLLVNYFFSIVIALISIKRFEII